MKKTIQLWRQTYNYIFEKFLSQPSIHIFDEQVQVEL